MSLPRWLGHAQLLAKLLGRKLVAVLPKMKCPHGIEPNQIQGLDFINILPVVQVRYIIIVGMSIFMSLGAREISILECGISIFDRILMLNIR